MRVCTFYESRLGRNDGPPLYWTNAMKKMGINVNHMSSENLPKDKTDFHLWVDWGEDGLTGLLPYKPIDVSSLNNTIYIASDTHLGFEYRVKKAEQFSRVFVNQKEAVMQFSERGVVAEWLPHAVEPSVYSNKPMCIKKYDVCFVGFVGFIKRAKFLDKVFREFSNFYYGQHFFEPAAEIYRQSRIVLNTSATDDINMRFFEGWATGSFTLSECVPSLVDLRLPVDVEMITYRDAADANDKIKYLISSIEGMIQRQDIINKMQEWILKYHTYQCRVKWAFGLKEEDVKSGKADCATVS